MRISFSRCRYYCLLLLLLLRVDRRRCHIVAADRVVVAVHHLHHHLVSADRYHQVRSPMHFIEWNKYKKFPDCRNTIAELAPKLHQ